MATLPSWSIVGLLWGSGPPINSPKRGRQIGMAADSEFPGGHMGRWTFEVLY